MSEFIIIHDLDGCEVYVRREEIRAMTRLPAYSGGLIPTECCERTRVDGPNGMVWLVHETPTQILSTPT